MTSEMLQKWFAKERWTTSDASLLLYGCDPDKWDYSVPKEKYRTEQLGIFRDMRWPQIESLLHDLRCDLEYEVSERTGEENLFPLRVAQWAWDVRERFWFFPNVLQYIQHPANGINYADNSWIDRGYDEYAILDSWTLAQAADLLSGEQVHRNYENKSWHLNERKDRIVWALHSLSMTNQMHVIERNGIKYFSSVELVNWAKKKGFSVPPKLLEKMGLGILTRPQKSDDSKKGTRENALHTELKALFEEWGKPETNLECWSRLRKIDWDARETVIQEVLPKKDEVDAHILWLSPHGKERRMKRSTFNNKMSDFRK